MQAQCHQWAQGLQQNSKHQKVLTAVNSVFLVNVHFGKYRWVNRQGKELCHTAYWPQQLLYCAACRVSS